MSASCRRWCAVLACLALAAPAVGQRADERRSTPGMRARIEQLVLPGGELEAKPADRKAPVMVRVLASWPHGSARRYDLEWTGFEPGKYDLAGYLARKDGSPAEGLPPIDVEVTALLPPGQVLPAELPAGEVERYPPYTAMLVAAGVLWVAGLATILFVARRRRRALAPPPPPPPTLADRLRPLVEAAAAGRLDEAGKAELERLLLAFWRARLGLCEATVADAIARLRAHPEAGALLRQLDAWLHMPAPAASVDLAALLAPYRAAAGSAAPPLPAEVS